NGADAWQVRRNLLKQFEPFAANRELEHAEPGEIAARPRDIRNEALLDRIRDLHEYDRDRASGLLDRYEVGCGRGHDHVGCQTNQLRCIGACKYGITSAPANIDVEISALCPS